MSEAELHILQGSRHQALLNKARRGNLSMQLPVGYVRLPASGFGFDPDERAQNTIRLIFDQFDRLGSVRRVLRYLHQQDIKLPVRPHMGPGKGEIEWRGATRKLTRTVLMHPLYAGTDYRHRSYLGMRRPSAAHAPSDDR